MKKLLFIFATILMALSAQAQTRYQLQAGDIVTISRVNGTTRNYLTVNENNGLVVHNEPNDNSLWVIHTCSYASNKNQYTLQHYKTGRYLKIEGSKSGNWWNSTYTITPSLITNGNPTTLYQDQPNTGENGVYEEGKLYFSYDNKKFELSVNNSNAWVFQQNGNQALQVEKWERQSGTDFASYFSPETYDFNLITSADKGIDNTNIDADTDIAQQRNVRFVVDLRESNYLTCKHKTSDKRLDEKVTVDSDLNHINLSPTFQWSSSKTAVSSLPASGTTGYLKNYLYEEADEHERGMLQFQKGEISDDNLAYELTLQSLGTSPIGLKRQIATGVTSWVNYVDYLVASWEYGGNTYTDSMRVIRKSYHTKPLPEFEFSVSPSTYTFGPGDGSQTFTIKGTHQHGTGYYDVDARLVDTVLIYGPVDMPLKDDEGKLEYKFSCLERNSEAVSAWLSVGAIDAINNTITLNAQANSNGYRQARLIVEVDLKQTQAGIDDPHNTIRAININQRSKQGTIDFYHQEGASYKNKDNDPTNDLKNNRQQVHTAERVIYYQPNQNIELRLAESNFFGYMRWYDYDSNGDGGDPMWHNEENKRTTWVTSPRGANGNAFRAINTSYGDSRGLYATAQDGQLTSNSENNPAPVLKGWDYGTYDPNAPTEEQKTKAIHTIACDVSAYTDYTLTDNNGERASITEPTLSYRQLFHLRPAEEIAAKLNTYSAADKYLENYHYMAAVGADVHLATQFRYTKYTHESELCYFYLVPKAGGGQELKRVGKDVQAKWYKKNGDNWEEVDNPNYQVYDYLNVDSDIKGVQVYALKVPKASTGLEKDLLIAQFEINFVDINSCGPRTTPIITDHEMELHFQLIKKIDFNYKADAVEYENGYKQLNAHLPWDESSYGYYYPKNGNPNLGETSPNRSGQNIPYYGEYFLVNQINKDWAKATAHGGTNDYALYVDGTTEPGLVASISTDTVICAGQTLYCSVWLNNPCPTNFSHNNPRNPIFRCNVQGKRKDVQGNWSDWEDISVFFVGQLPKGSGWQQVVFPVTSDYTYDETRVSIYNFATGGAGNDFMVDDITLFASRLPLASYQAQTNCASDANTPSSTAAILRIDYTAFEGIADHYMYYQIYNTSEDHVVELTKLDGQSAYYHDVDGETNRTYGSVHIPRNDFDPNNQSSALEEDKAMIFTTVQSFKDYLVDQITEDQKHVKGKAYIRSTIKGQERWLLYVMHIIPNKKKENNSEITAEEEKKYLWERYDYALRMANVPEELAAAECNMQTPLHATQATHFDLYNGYKEQTADDFIPESANNCANDYYTLQAKIENSISPGTGGTIQQIEGAVMGDWLVGYPFDDVYINTETRNDKSHKDSIETARTEFYKTYGYYREEVTSAIVYDLRRNDPTNTNRLVTRFEELDANAFEYPARNYTIIKDLYEKGLLILGQSQTSFYLASNDTARYWFFPIDGTATGTMKDMDNKDVTVTLQDCTEPIWVRVSSVEQPTYFANIAPLEKGDKSRLQRLQLPTVRITKAQAEAGTITIPVTEIGDETTLAGLADKKITINLNPLGQDVAFVDIENGTDITTTPELVIGQSYLMRMRMRDNASNVHIGGDSEKCRVGTIYFYLMILPNTVVWTPAEGSYNGWGLDENWRGWDDKNTNGVYDASELMEVGFVPVAGSDVIIPTLLDVTLYPYIHDHNHYPMDVNAHPSICNNIYFAPGAHIHNQHLLQYEKAFVDMTIPKGNWFMMSAPLQKMYSGDMYVPHEGTWESGRSLETATPFETGAFKGKRHSESAYAFWASYYNQSVKTWYNDGGYIESTSSSFQQSNGLNQPLEVGSGFALWGEGADVATGGNIVIRLPKQEDTYSTSSGTQVPVPRDGKSHKLAFTATQDAGENITPMTITLTNKKESEHFIFGNPTMAFINMHDFLHENKEVLNHTFYRLEGATWSAETEHTMTDNRYLAPMTSVMLETKDKSKKTELSVQLSPLHLTLTDSDDPFSEENPEIKPVNLRAKVAEEDASEIMSIYAYTNNAYARTVLATTPAANDYYLVGEDALFVSSGIESNSYVLTPLNMYTVAEQVPMMADVRQGISEIPLGMLVADGYRSQYMQVAFYLSSKWSRKCYFCDTKTGQKIRIMDGLVISVEMPLNHEQRYYIEGPDTYRGSDGVTTSTTQPNMSNTGNKVWAYSPDRSTVIASSSDIIESARLYDLIGRLITTTQAELLSNSITLQNNGTAGVYIVDVTLRNGTTARTQVIVQ
ncbi:MAG: T9SS type A sorting domain-containing protein [Paludibacteraceae bacterium]|nr:T9SS type A sorting domain-containing protein [Paludibacteraceae bacterium]